MLSIAFIVLGIITGGLAGLIGIGGGIIIVPALVYIFHFTQKTAQGTTLALLVPPIGFFAAYAYYKAGQVNIKAAALIITGFLIGSFIGAHYATSLPDKKLTQLFGVFVILAGIKMLFTK